MARGDYGAHSAKDLGQKLKTIGKRGQHGKRLLAEALVQTPLTVRLGLSQTLYAVIFDSHSHMHGESGAVLAVLHRRNDWAAVVGFLEDVLGSWLTNTLFLLRLIVVCENTHSCQKWTIFFNFYQLEMMFILSN